MSCPGLVAVFALIDQILAANAPGRNGHSRRISVSSSVNPNAVTTALSFLDSAVAAHRAGDCKGVDRPLRLVKISLGPAADRYSA